MGEVGESVEREHGNPPILIFNFILDLIIKILLEIFDEQIKFAHNSLDNTFLLSAIYYV